jgi:hypothetical protein
MFDAEQTIGAAVRSSCTALCVITRLSADSYLPTSGNLIDGTFQLCAGGGDAFDELPEDK